MEESQMNKLVPFTYAGNVPIKLKCYLVDKNINDNLKTHSIRVNSEFISLNEYNTHKNLDVVLEKKLAHESTLNCNQENLNTTVIVEVLPNGTKYKIPIKIKIKEVNMEPIITTSSPSSCSFSSNSFCSSSPALVSPQHQYKDNFLAATPDTRNSSSATMIIRKSPEIVQSASPIPAQTNLNSNRVIENTNEVDLFNLIHLMVDRMR